MKPINISAARRDAFRRDLFVLLEKYDSFLLSDSGEIETDLQKYWVLLLNALDKEIRELQKDGEK